MVVVDRDNFESMVARAVAKMPDAYRNKIDNIAFIVEDLPSEEQRVKLKLSNHQTLFGLYEGVPLPQRQGSLKIMPDKITIYQLPIQSAVNSIEELYDQVARTVWHEVAHYFGLDHQMIDDLNSKSKKTKE
jgi:predicted Zn-dependent protease with MMP-like domain